jgi:hypothetical protein
VKTVGKGLTLTVLSMPLTATMGNVGCCSMTGNVRRASKLNDVLTIDNGAVAVPNPFQSASLLIPYKEVAIVAPGAHLVRPHAHKIT